MKERPILFSTPMVQAIIDDRKTMTRRMNGGLKIVNRNPDGWKEYCKKTFFECPYGKKGDILYVKETHCIMDGECFFKASVKYPETLKWKSSLFMRKDIARIWLEISDTKVERVQCISDADSISEGVEVVGVKYSIPCFRLYTSKFGHTISAKDSFKSLWESINGADSWNQNPWVWVVSFKVLSTTGKPDLSTHQTNNSTP